MSSLEYSFGDEGFSITIGGLTRISLGYSPFGVKISSLIRGEGSFCIWTALNGDIMVAFIC